MAAQLDISALAGMSFKFIFFSLQKNRHRQLTNAEEKKAERIRKDRASYPLMPSAPTGRKQTQWHAILPSQKDRAEHRCAAP